jgi:uncharacterized protein (DUF2062 family)
VSGRLDLRRRLGRNLDETAAMLRRAFAEEHTTEEVAESFSLGVFVTMLPTLGTGFVAFLVLATVADRLSKLALFASAVVFNPVVKWGVYAASVTLGFFLLGPVEGISMSEVSLTAAPEVVLRLVVGNLILAVLAAVPSYFVAYNVVDNYRHDENSKLRQIAYKLGLIGEPTPAPAAETASED